jgi:hypothetical protein
MAFPQNHEQGDSSEFADDGTASHKLASWCLETGKDAASWTGGGIPVGDRMFEVTPERAAFVQVYVDDVRRRALGGHLFIEHRVELSAFGPDQFGTADAVIVQPEQKLLIVEDLKYGMGVKVYAKDNAQGLSYVLGALPEAELLADVDQYLFVVNQPRLGHIDEWTFGRAELDEFRGHAVRAIEDAGHAMALAPGDSDLALYLNPSDKTCRWCRAKTVCPKLAKYIEDEVRADFETISSTPPPVPTGAGQLSRAAIALPLVQQWCKAVQSELWSSVAGGQQIIGPDGQPFKIVEGDEGKRQWRDAEAAEAMLLGQLDPEKAYEPRKIITAPAAAKLLNKAKTKQLWEDAFVPLIERKKGQPQLVYGSDERPPYSGAASIEEFNDEISA